MLKKLAAGALAALSLAGVASAEVEISGNIAYTTDYVWRGVSQTDDSFAVQGGLDLAAGSFYVGTWASNVDFGDNTSAEVDLYGGFAQAFDNGLSYDVGVIGYFFTGSSGGADDLDATEIYGGVGYEFGPGVSVGAQVFHDFDNENTYVEGSVGYGITDEISVDATVGHYDFDGGGDYDNWSVGVTYALPEGTPVEGLELGVRYHDTDVDGDLTDERVVLTVSKSL